MTKEYLMETAREYISKYPERLKMFLEEFEADEIDFIKRELEYFEYTLHDVKNSETSHDGYSITGIDNFLIAYDLCNEIGWEKFMYSTEKKIKFLESKKPAPPQPIIESPFSVLEWATIFYYADETKLLPESRLLKTRFEQFMSKHQINTTFDNFKNSYYEAKRRINDKNDYPINKLESIIPFLKENYKQTVAKVENDIFFLKENKPDY